MQIVVNIPEEVITVCKQRDMNDKEIAEHYEWYIRGLVNVDDDCGGETGYDTGFEMWLNDVM